MALSTLDPNTALAGFNVTLAIDATTNDYPETHAYSIGKASPRLGETGTAQDDIDLFASRSA